MKSSLAAAPGVLFLLLLAGCPSPAGSPGASDSTSALPALPAAVPQDDGAYTGVYVGVAVDTGRSAVYWFQLTGSSAVLHLLSGGVAQKVTGVVTPGQYYTASFVVPLGGKSYTLKAIVSAGGVVDDAHFTASGTTSSLTALVKRTSTSSATAWEGQYTGNGAGMVGPNLAMGMSSGSWSFVRRTTAQYDLISGVSSGTLVTQEMPILGSPPPAVTTSVYGVFNGAIGTGGALSLTATGPPGSAEGTLTARKASGRWTSTDPLSGAGSWMAAQTFPE